jgi:cytoskeletal protein CcmA (bactofilin family)
MIKIKGLGGAEELNGFMDEGTEFIGELRFRDTFRIDGKLKGKVVSEHTLIVGESGQVEAEIDCAVISIKGTLSGRVHARQRIELLAGARVQATLVSPRLVIEEGAVFQGQCDMGSAAAATGTGAKGSVVPMGPGLRPMSEGRS